MNRSGIEHRTLAALYENAADSYAPSVALMSYYSWGYQSITYRELGRLISYTGTGLISRGLQKGDRVALVAENSPEWGVVYAAVTSCGGVIVPLDIDLDENEIRHLLFHAEAKFLVTSPSTFSEKIEGMNLQDVDVFVMGEGEKDHPDRALGRLMAIGRERINEGEGAFFHARAEVGPEDVAAVCYTSGTTGQPKGAVLLHRNIASNVTACLHKIPMTGDDRFLCLLHLNHPSVTTCNFLAPLSVGATVIVGRSAKPNEIREDVAKEGISILLATPAMLKQLVLSPGRGTESTPGAKRFMSRLVRGIASRIGRAFKKGLKLPASRRRLQESGLGSLRFCMSFAAKLGEDVESSYSSSGLPVIQLYGLTEAGAVVSANPIDRPKAGTVGPPLPGIEVLIDAPDEEGVGEITVRGPNVMMEYFKNPGATETALRDGWLHTGDLGRTDADGYISLIGKKKHTINAAGGKSVQPEEIEEIIDGSPLVLESLVLAAGDRMGGAGIAAIVVPDYNKIASSPEHKARLSEEGIRKLISGEMERLCSNLPEHKRIRDFQIRDEELPRTNTSKLKRHLVTWIQE